MKQSGQFLLFNRDEFNKWLTTTQFNRSIKLLQVHHTASPTYNDFNGSNHFSMLNSMKTYHTTRSPNGAGFSDIAQNITTFPDGMIAICRNLNKDPAGIFGANSGAICIENIGNFDIYNDIMTSEHRNSIIYLYATLSMRFNIIPSTNTIIYHHWFDLTTGGRTNGTGCTKTCPGTGFFGGNSVQSAQINFIPLIKTQINNLLKPQIQPWMNDVLNYLSQNKIILNPHDPFEQLNFSTFAKLINNMTDKLTDIEPISYLSSKGIIKSPHLSNELIPWSTLGFMIANRNNVVVSEPLQFLLSKGYIKKIKNPNAIVMFVEFGAVIMNAQKLGLII